MKTKNRKHSIICRRRRKRKLIEYNKFYYSYYKGWCDKGEHTYMFTTAAAAMVWQVYNLFRDGFSHTFSNKLPLTFSIIGVVEIRRSTENGILNSLYLTKQKFPDITNSDIGGLHQQSSKISYFFRNIFFYTANDNKLYDMVLQSYLQQLDKAAFEFIQKFFSSPDYYYSSNSIFRNNFDPTNVVLKKEYNLVSSIPSEIYVPRSYDDYRLSTSIAFELKQHLKNTNESDHRYVITKDNVDVFVLTHQKLIHHLKATEVVISLGSGVLL